MSRKKPRDRIVHNPKTCFGCRLYDLIKELYPGGIKNNEQLTEVLSTLATCSATTLYCNSDKEGLKLFLAGVYHKVLELADEQDKQEPTLH